MPTTSPARSVAPRRAISRRRHAAGDDGSATAELLLVLPAIMVTVAAALQLAFYGLAAHALALAVAEGGAAARAGTARPAALSLVREDVARLAGGILVNLDVKVGDAGSGSVTVSARASVVSLLPGFHISVASSSTGPSQVFRASG